MKNENENDAVDDVSEESFPASDPPSWFAGPSDAELDAKKSPVARLRAVGKAFENRDNLLVIGAVGSALTAAILFSSGRKRAGCVAALFAPLLLSVRAAGRRSQASASAH